MVRKIPESYVWQLYARWLPI